MVKTSESLSGRESGRRTNFLSTLTFCIKVVTSGREFLGFCVMSLRFGAKGKRAVKAAVKRG